MMGNEAFRSGDFKQAEEYYTSALMQWDKVDILKTLELEPFTNNAILELCPLHKSRTGEDKIEEIPRCCG